MLEKLEQVERRYEELAELMAQPENLADPRRLQALGQERAGLEEVVARYREYKAVTGELDKTRQMLAEETDRELAELAREEIAGLTARQERLQQAIRLALVPRDPNDDKDIIVEIRAGTGGDEAGLFAADLFRMYSRYAQTKGWKVEVISASEGSAGGFKEIIFEVDGRGAFSRLKYERGVHRVQRVPVTEAAGRIHTSTVTVAVLPKAEEVDIDINPDDLRIDIYHASSAGGQNVNKVATAVRITHLPTGMVVACQDERSQLKNKQKAMAVLRARLLDAERRRQEAEIVSERRAQVGSGERAEKVRTYNFPQDRLTDHRIGLTLHNLPRILTGEMDELVDALAADEQARRLEAQLV